MDLGEYRRNREIENPSGESRSKNAFDNLVFPNDGLDRKKIIRSLVAQHFRDRESETNRAEQFDIVRGKGNTRQSIYIAPFISYDTLFNSDKHKV